MRCEIRALVTVVELGEGRAGNGVNGGVGGGGGGELVAPAVSLTKCTHTQF